MCEHLKLSSENSRGGSSLIAFRPLVRAVTQEVKTLVQFFPLVNEKGFEQGFTTSQVSARTTGPQGYDMGLNVSC